MNNSSVKYGIIAGVSSIFYMLLFYFIDKRMMLGMGVYWSSLLIYLGLMYKACTDIRQDNGGFITFQDALRTAFTTFLIANVFFFTFYYVLFNFVEPGLIEIQKEMAIEVYNEVLGEQDAAKMQQSMEKEGFDMTVANTAMGFAKGAIGGFLLSLIIAAIAKRM